MSPFEIIRSAMRGLTANKLRSSLTVLGILIGVGAVILLVAVGNGSAQQIKDRISALGSNTLTISSTGGRGSAGPGGARSSSANGAQALTLPVADALKNKSLAPDVKSVSPVQTSSQTVTYAEQSATVSITGTTPGWFAASNTNVASGAAFTDSDNDQHARVAVIGSTTAENLFGRANPIGQQVSAGGVRLTVVGILAAKDSTGFQDPNDVVVAPITTVRDTLAGYGTLQNIVVQGTSTDTMDEAQSEVTAILNQKFHLTNASDATYRVLNQAQLASTQTDTANTFTVLLGAVAAISLLVGGIGVTNIMLVTVTERTREIGIRKALGAKRGALLWQFLAEATALSLIGGLLGIAAGVIGSRFTIQGVVPVLVPSSIVLAFCVSAAIGLFFGSYPAGRAARLQPIDALRYQ